jgi:parallel beta-helix repeat protein
MRRFSQAVITLIMLFASLPARSDEGRIPIFASPTLIAAPGKYFLTDNLMSPPIGSTITVAAGNVDIDLNGFTLTGSGLQPSITATGVVGLRIHNGSTLGGGASIHVEDSTAVVIEDIDSFAAQPLSPAGAIDLAGVTQFVVRRNLVHDVNGVGIRVQASQASQASGIIADNLIKHCSDSGIDISGGSVNPNLTIARNQVHDVGGFGVILSSALACVVEENTVDASGLDGIRLTASRCRIEKNIVSGAGSQGYGVGMQVSGSDNLVRDNVVSGSSNRGFLFTGFHDSIEGNIANANGSFGFHISGGSHVYRRNLARGNGGVAGDPPICLLPCSADLCVDGSGGTNSSAGDNFLPGPPTAPACV